MFSSSSLTRHTIAASLLALAALPSMVIPSAHAASPKPKSAAQLAAFLKTGALATFAVSGEKFRVWTTNPTTIAQLRALLAGTSQAYIPNGRILRGSGKAGYNAPWHWHLDPNDIHMAEVTTEVCDGRPSYVNAHLTDFTGRVKRYCPWGAKLIGLRVMGNPAVPSPPSNLRVVSTERDATSAQRTTVTLAWRDNGSTERGYRIHASFTRQHGGTDGATQGVSANASSASITFVAGGINPVAKVCFTVRALSRGGESAPSNEVCVTF